MVERAQRWLKNTKKCAVVLSEVGCYFTDERPDALGWLANGESILIECKTSRADFLREMKKPVHTKSEWRSYGARRYFMVTPIGGDGQQIILPDDKRLPKGWGVLIFNGKQVKVAKEPAHRDTLFEDRGHPGVRQRRDAEIALLVAELRRTQSGYRNKKPMLSASHR